jgi:hypothetical protein
MLRETLFGIVHIGDISEVEKLLNTLRVVIKRKQLHTVLATTLS